MIKSDCERLYLMGDVFDYWFEYREVIPKGFLRIQAALLELRDADIPVFFFTGNHDMWMFRYFETHLGIPIIREPIIEHFGGKTFMLGHGDGLGPGDHGYKFIKKIFANPICQWLFARVHPNLGIGLMRWTSQHSRGLEKPTDQEFREEKEWLVHYCNNYRGAEQPDYFIFGHRHLPIYYKLPDKKGHYINLGEWLHHCSYAVFDGKEVQLLFFESDQPIKIHGNITSKY